MSTFREDYIVHEPVVTTKVTLRFRTVAPAQEVVDALLDSTTILARDCDVTSAVCVETKRINMRRKTHEDYANESRRKGYNGYPEYPADPRD